MGPEAAHCGACEYSLVCALYNSITFCGKVLDLAMHNLSHIRISESNGLLCKMFREIKIYNDSIVLSSLFSWSLLKLF